MKRNDIVMVALPPPLGGKPVLIDSERRSWNIDPAMVAETVERKARQGKRPKAVVSVHLYSQSAELAPILEICARYAIPVHRGRRRGAGRHVSGQSAGNLGQGGRLLLQRQQDHHRLGQHSEIGYNYRLSNVLAGIGRGQLQVIEERVQARQRNFAFYQETLGDLPGIDFMPEAPWGRHTPWLTVITVDARQLA